MSDIRSRTYRPKSDELKTQTSMSAETAQLIIDGDKGAVKELRDSLSEALASPKPSKK